MNPYYTVILMILVIGAVGCSQINRSDKKEILLLINQGGSLNDGSFNSMSYKGLENYYDGIDPHPYSYLIASDGERNSLMMASDTEQYSLIIAPGFSFHDALKQVSLTEKYQNQKYLSIDIEENFDQPNILQYIFKENEGAYLAGVLAAVEAKKAKAPAVFGFIGGIKSAVVSRFEDGYSLGIKAVSPDAVIKSYYTGDWGDSVNAKIVSKQWYSDKVFAIMTAAGAGNGGAISTAKELHAKGTNNAWIIGVDSDVYADGMNDGHSVVLTSVVKAIDQLVYDSVNQLEHQHFKGGFKSVGVEDGLIYLSRKQSVVDADSWAIVDTYKNKIINKEITTQNINIINE